MGGNKGQTTFLRFLEFRKIALYKYKEWWFDSYFPIFPKKAANADGIIKYIPFVET